MTVETLLRNLNLANQLTFLRLVAVPFLILAVIQARFGVALVLFLSAALTDALDGLTARVLRQRTVLGTYLDPAADKLLMTSAFVLLTDYPNMLQSIPMAYRIPIGLTVLAISRDVLIVAVALMLYLAHGQTRFLPSIWGKVTTASEFILVAALLVANFVGRAHIVLDVLVWLTLVLILVSGFHYLGRTIRVLHPGGRDDPDPRAAK